MKKIYLLGLLAMGMQLQAQTQKPIDITKQSAETSNTKTLRDITPISPVVNPNNRQNTSSSLGKASRWVTVGQTMFDRPTNSSTYRRVISYPDGKKSVIWTTAQDGPAAYSTRGSGYNHFDGTSWKNFGNTRIETSRTGYCNLDYDPIGGKEIVLAHRVDADGKSNGMALSMNTGIGSNSWTSTTVLDTTANLPGALWPRTVVSGDYLIVFASFTDSSQNQPSRVVMNGVRTPQVYSRYNLRTNTWLVKNQPLPGYDNTRYYAGGGDNYAMDAIGNNVAILIGGLTDDVALWKSADAGETWTKTIIDSFPAPAFNYKVILADTPMTNDGALAVRLDNSGKAHCFWAISRVLDVDTNNNTLSFFPGQNTIAYWYEGRPDSIVRAGFSPEDPSDGDEDWAIGSVIENRAQYGNMSMTTAPYAVSNGDTLFLLYHSRTDNDQDQQDIAFTDVYVTYSLNNGASWSNPVNLTGGDNLLGLSTEQAFVSAAADCATSLKLTFMNTTTQGFYDATDNNNKLGPFDVVYYEVPVIDVISNTLIGLNKVNNLFSLEQNYPNPFTHSTNVPVNLNRSSDVTISVVNMVGQAMYSNTFTNNVTGLNTFEVNMSSAKPGIYFYTVEVGDFKVTRKMIIE